MSRPTTAAKSESDQDDRKESPGWEKSQQENPQKATPFESNSIMQMLTDKRYPTWGVSRLRGRVVSQPAAPGSGLLRVDGQLGGNRAVQVLRGAVR